MDSQTVETPEAAAVSTTPKPQAGILSKAVPLHVRLGRPGKRARVAISTVDVHAADKEAADRKDADKAALHLSKELFDCPEYRAICHLDQEVRGWLLHKALPSILRGGVYLIPLALIETAKTFLDGKELQRAALIEAFLGAYPHAVKKAKDTLGDLYHEQDYPDVDTMRKAFAFERQYLAFETPTSLKKIKEELFQQEAAKAATRWVEAEKEIQQLLRAEMSELVEHMVDRLATQEGKDGEAGKPKVFRKTLTVGIQEFLDGFDARNVSDDAALAELVSKARVLLSGVGVESLRKSDALRETVHKGFAEMKTALDGMVTQKAMRFIATDEAEAEA